MIDGVARKRIFEALKECHKMGMTILNITHESEEITYGTHLLILDKGQVVLQEPVKKALEKEKVFTTSQMELPFIPELSTKLKYYQVVKKTYHDKESLVEALWK